MDATYYPDWLYSEISFTDFSALENIINDYNISLPESNYALNTAGELLKIHCLSNVPVTMNKLVIGASGLEIESDSDFCVFNVKDKGVISLKNEIKFRGAVGDLDIFASGGFNIDGLKIDMPTYLVSNGEYIQLASHIEVGKLIISAPKGVYIGDLPNIKVYTMKLKKADLGVSIYLNSNEGGLKFGYEIRAYKQDQTIVSPAVSSITVNDLKILSTEGNLHTRGLILQYQQALIEAMAHIDEPAISSFFSATKEWMGSLYLKLGFRTNLGSAIAASREAEQAENGINKVSAGYAAFTEWMKFFNLPFQFGLYVHGKLQEHRMVIEKVEPVASEFVGNTMVHHVDKLRLQGTKVIGYSWYLTAEEVMINSAFSSFEQQSSSRSLEAIIPINIGGNISPSLNLKPLDKSSKYEKDYLQAEIHLDGELVFDIAGRVNIEGAYIEADSLIINAKSLLIKSVQKLVKERGSSLSISLGDISSIGQAFNGVDGHVERRDSKWVHDVTQLLGRSKMEIIIAEALHIVGAIVASAERDTNGVLTDKGKLHIKAAEIFAESIHGYDKGILLGVSVSLVDKHREEAQQKKNDGVMPPEMVGKDKKPPAKPIFGSSYGGQFGYTDLEQEVKAGIGKGVIEGPVHGDYTNDINNVKTVNGIKIDPIKVKYQSVDYSEYYHQMYEKVTNNYFSSVLHDSGLETFWNEYFAKHKPAADLTLDEKAQTILDQVIAGVEKDDLHPQQKANFIKIAEEEFGKFTKMDPVAQEIYLSEIYDRLYGSKKDPNLVGSIGSEFAKRLYAAMVTYYTSSITPPEEVKEDKEVNPYYDDLDEEHIELDEPKPKPKKVEGKKEIVVDDGEIYGPQCLNNDCSSYQSTLPVEREFTPEQKEKMQGYKAQIMKYFDEVKDNPEKIDEILGLKVGKWDNQKWEKAAHEIAVHWVYAKEKAAAASEPVVEYIEEKVGMKLTEENIMARVKYASQTKGWHLFPDGVVDPAAAGIQGAAEVTHAAIEAGAAYAGYKFSDDTLQVLEFVTVATVAGKLMKKVAPSSKPKPEMDFFAEVNSNKGYNNNPTTKLDIQGDAGNIQVKSLYEKINSPATFGRIDYSEGFVDSLENFNYGSSKLHNGPLQNDLVVVNFHDYNKDIGFGKNDRTMKWATHIEEAANLNNVDDVLNRLALVYPDWGERNAVSLIRVPKGTDVTFIYGSAVEKVSEITGDKFIGNGFQLRFRDFDKSWIVDTKKLK